MTLALDKIYAVEHLIGLKHFHLPKITCSIPTLPQHPDSLYASDVAHKWMFKFMDPNMTASDKKALMDWKLPSFMTMMVPIGSTKCAVTCAKYSLYATLMDDAVDEGGVETAILQEYYTTIMDHFRNPNKRIEASDDHLPIRIFSATEAIVPEIRSSMSPMVYARFVASLGRYAQTRLVKRPKFQSIDNYLKWRRFEFFFEPCFSFMEMAIESAISDSDMESEGYITVRDAAIDYVVCFNDLLSFAKEYACNKLLNLPSLVLLSDPEVTSLQGAIDKVYAMTLEKEKEFLYYQGILLARAKAANKHDFAKFLELLANALSNAVLFHYSTARYHPSFVKEGSESFDGNWDLDEVITARRNGR